VYPLPIFHYAFLIADTTFELIPPVTHPLFEPGTVRSLSFRLTSSHQ
jgi:hypothetical protein